MLTSGNPTEDAALAEALAAGGSRNVGFVLKFDWDRTPGHTPYGTDFADFSDNVNSVTLDAQLTGSYPDEYEINDGYAQRRLTITVTGYVNNIRVTRFFSPYGGYYGGSIGAVGTLGYFSVLIRTSVGVVERRQFTGYILTAKPSKADSNVVIEMADITSQLTNPITLAPTARSVALAQSGLNTSTATDASGFTVNDRIRQRGSNSLSWYLLHACRQSGLYQGPTPPAASVWYQTLQGGVLPEIGTFNQIPLDGNHRSDPASVSATTVSAAEQVLENAPLYRTPSSLDFGSYTNQNFSNNCTDIETPHKYPRYMWEKGPFGPRMIPNIYTDSIWPALQNLIGQTSAKPGPYPANSAVDALSCFGYTSQPLIYDATGSTQVSRIGISLYQRFSATDFAAEDGLLARTQAYGMSKDQPSPWPQITFIVNPAAGASTGSLWLVFGTSQVYRIPVTIPDGEHFIGIVYEKAGSGGTSHVYFNVDGVISAVTVGAGSNTAVSTYEAVPPGEGPTHYPETSVVQMQSTGGASHFNLFNQVRVTPATPIDWGYDATNWPAAPPAGGYPLATTDISRSMARMMWTPNIQAVQAWDLIKDIGSADLGAIYADEYGTLHYTNLDEIRANRASTANLITLTLDEVDEINPYSTFDSVANTISYTSQDKWFTDDVVFKASDVLQFMTPGNQVPQRWQLSVDNVMGIQSGQLLARPLAQGVWYSHSGTTSGNPDNPNGTTYTWQDFVRAYSPEVWKNGYEAHNQGDATGTGQPLVGAGVFAWALAGWAQGDLDPRHLTVVTRSVTGTASSPGRTSMIAVDDNTPFLNVRGLLINSGDQFATTVQPQAGTDAAISVATFGVRTFSRAQSDWSSDFSTQYDLTQLLANELGLPRPVFDTLNLLGDPRRQLQDVVQIKDTDADGIGGPIMASVVGINRTYSDDGGIRETLALRTFGTRGGAWILGDPVYSVLGSSTILSAD